MTLETQTTNPKTIKPRRWFRFRLRTMLILVTLLSAVLGWVGWELDQRRREKVVVAWIEEMGGGATFVYQPDERSWWEKTKDKWFGEKVQTGSVSGTKVTDLSPLVELKNLKGLMLHATPVSALSQLAEFKNLKWLQLINSPVSDVSALAEFKNLEMLSLNDTRVSDLSPLAELKNLRSLLLNGTWVSDVSALAELKNLEMLNLNDTRVSDLSPLAELRKLKWLDLNSTHVSAEQVQELEQALPNCTILFNRPFFVDRNTIH